MRVFLNHKKVQLKEENRLIYLYIYIYIYLYKAFVFIQRIDKVEEKN